MRLFILLTFLFLSFVALSGYKLEDARHLLKNECYDQCGGDSHGNEMDTIRFDTTNRGKGQWFQENGIWKRRRPDSLEQLSNNKKRIRFDRRMDPDAGIDPLDSFGI